MHDCTLSWLGTDDCTLSWLGTDDCTLSWLGTDTSIKRGKVKLVLWAKTSTLRDIMQSCKSFLLRNLQLAQIR